MCTGVVAVCEKTNISALNMHFRLAIPYHIVKREEHNKVYMCVCAYVYKNVCLQNRI